jgi:hypothetical protein
MARSTTGQQHGKKQGAQCGDDEPLEVRVVKWTRGHGASQMIWCGFRNERKPNLVHPPLRITFAAEIATMTPPPSQRRTVALTLATLLCLHGVFFLNHLVSWPLPVWLQQLDAGLESQRAVLMILEGIAAAVVFVDLITRFDELNRRVRPAHVLLVALGIIGVLAQIFVFFLDSALSLA